MPRTKLYVPAGSDAGGDWDAQWVALGEGVNRIPYTEEVLSQSPYWYWRLEETSGTDISDRSGNGRTGDVNSGVTLGAVGQVGNAFDFPGGGNLGVLRSNNSSDATQTFSVTMWVNPDDALPTGSSESTSGTSAANGNERWAMQPSNHTSDAGAGLSVGTNGIKYAEHADSHAPFRLVHYATLSGWNHVGVVCDARKPRMYLNGVLVRSNDSVTTSTIHAPFRFGRTTWGGTDAYDGRVDEIAFWSRVLTADEIQAQYEAGL